MHCDWTPRFHSNFGLFTIAAGKVNEMKRDAEAFGGGKDMKSFWIGTIAAIVIAVAAGAILESSNMSSGQKYSTSSTRL